MDKTLLPKDLRFFDNKLILELFNQLKAYHNFRIDFFKQLEKGDNNNKYIHNQYYLIDRKWIENWEKYIGYDEIKNLFPKNKIEDNDLQRIIQIILKNSNENTLHRLNNEIIYKDGKIDPFADFIIVNKKCHILFVKENEKNKLYETSFPVKFFKEKLILILIKETFFFILFKDEK